MQLPAYTGDDTVCIKCRHTEATTRYHSLLPSYAASSCPTSYETEHLCRHCERCGFAWPEAVASDGSFDLDTEKAALRDWLSSCKKTNKFLSESNAHQWKTIMDLQKKIAILEGKNHED